MVFEITYCAVWNYKPEADRVSSEIESITGVKPALIAAGGGTFDVRKDGKVLFSKFKSGRFPEMGEVAALIA